MHPLLDVLRDGAPPYRRRRIRSEGTHGDERGDRSWLWAASGKEAATPIHSALVTDADGSAGGVTTSGRLCHSHLAGPRSGGRAV